MDLRIEIVRYSGCTAYAVLDSHRAYGWEGGEKEGQQAPRRCSPTITLLIFHFFKPSPRYFSPESEPKSIGSSNRCGDSKPPLRNF